MANVLIVPDAYADQFSELLAIGRQKLPVQVVDSSSLPAPTWANVLVSGNESSGTDPIITGGDTLRFAGTGQFQAPSSFRWTIASTNRLSLSADTLSLIFQYCQFNSTVVNPTLRQQASTAPGHDLYVQGQESTGATSAAVGGGLNLQGGEGGTNASGGYVSVVGGIGGAAGGDAELKGGASTGASATGGNVAIAGGGALTAGNVSIDGGAGTNSGGDITVNGGTSSVAGGDVTVEGGSGGSTGGTVLVQAGYSSTTTGRVQVRGAGAQLLVDAHDSELGFFGTTAIAKPTVTGSTGANVALQNLLTALANLGLITDSTT